MADTETTTAGQRESLITVKMDAYDRVTLQLQRLTALCDQLGDSADDHRLSCVFSILAEQINRQREILIEGVPS